MTITYQHFQMVPDLIYDIGCNNGDDTDFYLRKGFRVVAVDAAEELCQICRRRFCKEISERRLEVIYGAVTSSNDKFVDFFINDNFSEWNTCDPYFVERNSKLGATSHDVRVPAVRISDLFDQYGIPYYMKIDIEGMDIVPLYSLQGRINIPQFISLELNDHDKKLGLEQILMLGKLGYSKFQFVNQVMRTRMRPPNPAREGIYANYDPSTVSSGLFGSELGGKWINFDKSIRKFLNLHSRYKLFRDHPLYSKEGRFGGTVISKIHNRFNRHIFRDPVSWYDLHAKL